MGPPYNCRYAYPGTLPALQLYALLGVPTYAYAYGDTPGDRCVAVYRQTKSSTIVCINTCIQKKKSSMHKYNSMRRTLLQIVVCIQLYYNVYNCIVQAVTKKKVPRCLCLCTGNHHRVPVGRFNVDPYRSVHTDTCTGTLPCGTPPLYLPTATQ